MSERLIELTGAEWGALKRLADSEEFRGLPGLARAIGVQRTTLRRVLYEEGRLLPFTARRVREFLEERRAPRKKTRRSTSRAAGRLQAAL